jgi:uncharacterized repeat protein (TIGR01451 family)
MKTQAATMFIVSLAGLLPFAPAAHAAPAVPAELVPIVAKTLASHSPAWRARFVTGQAAVVRNSLQHFHARFGDYGMTLEMDGRSPAHVGMQLVAVRSGKFTRALPNARPQINGPRVTLAHGQGVTEWYLNSPLGLEQGFTLTASPAHSSSVTLVFRLGGNLAPVLRNNTLEFRNGSDKVVLRYADLLATDADHHALPAHLALVGRMLKLAVDTRHARYPVTIDPLFSAVTAFNDPLAASDDFFATSVAVSSDGTTALIGASGVTVSGKTFVGAAYVFTRINGTWSSTPVAVFADPPAATNDEFGNSVALSGDGNTAVIAAPGTSVSGNAGAGKVYLYSRSNGTWSATPAMVFSDPTALANDEFGYTTVLSADGKTVLIGAPYTAVAGNTYAGDAYLYQQQNGAWPGTPTATFGDPAAGAKDYFGTGLALTANGAVALIGAPGTTVSGNASAGAAYLYVAANGAWTTTPSMIFTDPKGVAYDDFGFSPALSGDGSTALIGAYGATAAGVSGAGIAYAYTQTNGVWSATPTATFSEPTAGAGDYFGYTTALSSDGKTAVIGAPNTAVSGNARVGAAYGYSQNSGAWSTAPVKTFSSQAGAYGAFGGSLALSVDGTAALIGASGATVSGVNNVGAAFLFASPTDLSLALSSSPASVTTGQSVTYMLTVTNNDSQVTASNLTLADTLPAGMTFVSDSAIGGTCNNASGTVTCTLASLAPQATWQPSFTVTANSAGSIQDKATVSANQPDPNTANNSATTNTTVTTPPAPPSSGGGGGALGGLGLLFLGLCVALRRRNDIE